MTAEEELNLWKSCSGNARGRTPQKSGRIKSSKNRSAIGKYNNELGPGFETEIGFSCEIYRAAQEAIILKTPEPFRVLQKGENGRFIGVFGHHAQPDYTGTLKGGRSIIFEAKATATDRIKYGVLSETQVKLLNEHNLLGALCFVLVQIKDRRFAVPWNVFSRMKEIYGHQYVSCDDIKEYEIFGRPKNPLPFLDVALADDFQKK